MKKVNKYNQFLISILSIPIIFTNNLYSSNIKTLELELDSTKSVSIKKENYKYLDHNTVIFNKDSRKTCGFNIPEAIIGSNETISERFNKVFKANTNCNKNLDKNKYYKVELYSGKSLGHLSYNLNKGWEFSDKLNYFKNNRSERNLINIYEDKFRNNSLKIDCKVFPTGRKRYPLGYVVCSLDKKVNRKQDKLSFILSRSKNGDCYEYDPNSNIIKTENKNIISNIIKSDLENSLYKYISTQYPDCK